MSKTLSDGEAQSEYDRAKIDLNMLRGQIAPRLRHLVLNKIVLYAILSGVICAVLASYLPVGEMTISSVVANGFTFASIAMGSCISAIVLSLGLPGAERLRKWSNMNGPIKGKSVLSDLVFALTWAALAQVALILVCVLATLFGGNLPLAPESMTVTHWLGLAISLIVFLYAVLELVVVVQTLVQIGVMIIVEERTALK
jgi:hypothetical protein